MKSKPNSFNMATKAISVTPSLVMEYLFCPRFIYFMECLNIPQHEERRLKVQLGRKVHETKQQINKDYLRKKIGCIAFAMVLLFGALPAWTLTATEVAKLLASDGAYYEIFGFSVLSMNHKLFFFDMNTMNFLSFHSGFHTGIF